MNLAWMGNKTDIGQRLYARKGLADSIEPQAGADVVLLCRCLRLHNHLELTEIKRPQDSGAAFESTGRQFHRPIFSSSCLKFSRVISVTSSMAVYFGGSLPVVTHSNIISAVL